MKKNKVIYQSKNRLFSPFGLLLITLIGAYFVYISESLSIKIFMAAIFVTSIIAAIVKNYFATSILVKEEEIILTKHSFWQREKTEKLSFDAIKNLKWNHGKHRQTRAIYLKTDEKKSIKILISENPFEFGHVLKFFYNQGIPIDLVHSDHELELYIKDKIKTFPMTNEPEIEQKK